jgi:hypothetical protein
VIAVVVAGLALLAACSGSSSDSGAPARRSGPRHRPRPAVPKTARQPTAPRTRGTVAAGLPTRVVSVPRSIDATGHRDVQKLLQAFIANVPDGSTIEFQKDGKYRLERTLYIRHKRELTFDGNGATIFATKRGALDRSQIRVRRGRDLVFRDLVVRGVNPNGGLSDDAYVKKLAFQHGFRLEGVNGVELDDVRVTDVYGDCVYIGRDKRKHASRDVWIHDSTFARNGRQGIGITDAQGVVIEHNRFSDMRRATVDLEPNGHSWTVSKVFILDNTVGKGRLLFVASHGQGPVDNVVISGNVLHGHDLTVDVLPPEGERRSNWVVTDNVSDTVIRHRPMRFFSIDGLVVKGNTQRVTGGDPGVVLTDDCGIVVSGNRFGDAGVRRSGARCAAPLAIPAVPSHPGRSGPPPSTPMTSTPTTAQHRPTATRHPATTRRPTRPRPNRPERSNGGRLLLAAVALVLAGAALAWIVRRRRSLR